ncbi:hypothetical protein WMF27_42365 [Sorangium sp. So ce281]|uniref:hypothetical protein n=1 Tax=Sorangium sp. So ce281 TaxID=3133293 RepID=UPI003F6150E4
MAIARRLFIEHLRSARRGRLGAPDTLDGAATPRAAVPPDEELAARRMAGAGEPSAATSARREGVAA